jgi:hypothetical protein
VREPAEWVGWAAESTSSSVQRATSTSIRRVIDDIKQLANVSLQQLAAAAGGGSSSGSSRRQEQEDMHSDVLSRMAWVFCSLTAPCRHSNGVLGGGPCPLLSCPLPLPTLLPHPATHPAACCSR